MQHTLYAVYESGCAEPSYVGLRNAEPVLRSPRSQWLHAHCRYVGAGAWIDDTGAIQTATRDGCLWSMRLAAMSPAERLALRVVVLAVHPPATARVAEHAAIVALRPPYNLPTVERATRKRAVKAAYTRRYQPAYLAARPDKLAARREYNRNRQRARRAALREGVA